MRAGREGADPHRRGGTLRVVRTYPHPPGRVWRALTDAELLAQWLMPNDFVPAVGHRFAFRTEPGPGFDGVVRCEVLELDEPRRMTWSWRGGPLDTVVTFELLPVEPGATRLQVVHSGFRGLKARLVQRILGIGNRTIYRRRLPAVLAALARGGPAPSPDTVRACMSPWQRALAFLIGRLPGSSRRSPHA